MDVRYLISLATAIFLSSCMDTEQPPAVPEARGEEAAEASVQDDDAISVTRDEVTLGDEAAPVPPPPSSPPIRESLTLTLPGEYLRVGSRVPFRSQVADLREPAQFRYVLEREGGKDPGTVDADGIYTAPAQVDADAIVQVTSIWLGDEAVRRTERMTLIARDQFLVPCARTKLLFPIETEVFEIADTVQRLPDFNALAPQKKVCMDQVNIADQDGLELFPQEPALNASFALRLKTKIFVATAGSYVLRLNSDDGSRLSIDDKLVIDNDGVHQATTRDARVQLTAGEHGLTLEYFQSGGAIALELLWREPNRNNFEIIPRAMFR